MANGNMILLEADYGRLARRFWYFRHDPETKQSTIYHEFRHDDAGAFGDEADQDFSWDFESAQSHVPPEVWARAVEEHAKAIIAVRE